MNHTNNPTALQSQKWILQALLDLMQENSYDKISVSEICRRAGLDRRTFYRNFDSRQDVLEQYIKQLSDEYMTEFHKIRNPDKYAAALLFFQFWEKHKLFIRDMRRCGLSNYIFDQFKIFSESQKELLPGRETEHRKANYILAYQIGGFWHVMQTWVDHDTDLPAEELAAAILQV